MRWFKLTKLDMIQSELLRKFVELNSYDFKIFGQGTSNDGVNFLLYQEISPGYGLEEDIIMILEKENKVLNSRGEVLMNEYGDFL